MTPTVADILAAAPPRVGWQAVETAPWGLRDILVRYGGGGHDVWHARHGRPVMADITHWSELPPFPDAPSEADALQVALDRAEEFDEYSIELRQRIAELLPRLRIASAWMPINEDATEVARVCVGGTGFLVDARWNDHRAQERLDEHLTGERWVLAPQPPRRTA